MICTVHRAKYSEAEENFMVNVEDNYGVNKGFIGKLQNEIGVIGFVMAGFIICIIKYCYASHKDEDDMRIKQLSDECSPLLQ